MLAKRRVMQLERRVRQPKEDKAFFGLTAEEWLEVYIALGTAPELAAEGLYADEMKRLRRGIERCDRGVINTAVMTLGCAVSWLLRDDR